MRRIGRGAPAAAPELRASSSWHGAWGHRGAGSPNHRSLPRSVAQVAFGADPGRVDSPGCKSPAARSAILVLAVLAVAGALWGLAGVAGLRAVPEFSLKGIDLAPELVRVIIAGWAAMLIVGAVLLLALHR